MQYWCRQSTHTGAAACWVQVGDVTGLVIRYLKLLPEGIIATEQQVRALVAAQKNVKQCQAVRAAGRPSMYGTLGVTAAWL